MSCEFSQPDLDCSQPTCRKGIVLRAISARDGLGGVYTLAELMELICYVDLKDRKKLCPAYNDLIEKKRRSLYCK